MKRLRDRITSRSSQPRFEAVAAGSADSEERPVAEGVSMAAKILFAILALRKQQTTKSAVFAAHLKYWSIISVPPLHPRRWRAGRVYPAIVRPPVDPMCRNSEELRRLLNTYRRVPGSTYGMAENIFVGVVEILFDR